VRTALLRSVVSLAGAALLAALAACAGIGTATAPMDAVDFSRYTDDTLPAETSVWLRPSKQSAPGSTIVDAASKIDGDTRRHRVYQVVDYIWRNFRYDRGLNSAMLARTAEQLFQDKALGGCADYALAEAALFRAAGVPARLVLTANVGWMNRFRTNELAMTTGHVFIEVFLENKWYLVDPTFRLLYPHYDGASKSYPRGEYFVARGQDFWELGLIDVPTLVALFRAQALRFHREEYKEPAYAIDGLGTL
jgi:transglutaminase-like putative cysteine protease